MTASSSERGPEGDAPTAITEAVVDFLERHGVTTYAFARSPSTIIVSLPNEPELAVERHVQGIKNRLQEISFAPPSGRADLVARDPRDHRAILIELKPAHDGAQIRDDIVRALKDEEPELRQRGIESLRLFGSVASGKPYPGDVDLLARFRPGLRLSAFDIAETQAYLEQRLGRRVDLSNEKLFPSDFMTTIEKTGVRIFGS